MNREHPIPAKAIGDILADSHDDYQAEALNEFGRLLHMLCRGAPGQDTQLCYIADHLDMEGEYLITNLAEFIKIKKERT